MASVKLRFPADLRLSEHFQLVLLVESGRMARVAHDETGPVVVHAPFAPAYEQMRSRAHGGCAVEEWCRQCGRPVCR
ncbi:Hypothetical protein NTJ_04877 [Nesidiocoris tenuis]|uniref:Uncharacterized protein n=1 Tax=Nesidiocoris tenuis TaxID=355587 RepID=A0ABN7ALG5_9HEMI|nr:Hypothetical protein NTJ_04877 [Nesidiocoris tenuis]